MKKCKLLSRQQVNAAALAATLVVTAHSQVAVGQSPSSDLHTDPQSGIVYRKETKIIERPVVERLLEQKEQIVYKPETVTEIKPEYRTTYRPVTEMKWKPYVSDRWNPFKAPRVSYHQVPETRWEARSEIYNRRKTETRWVPETRTVEVPRDIVRYEREQRVDYRPIARVMPQPSVSNGVNSAVAARLKPLDPNSTLAPLSTDGIPPTTNYSSVASSTVEPPLRSANQAGMRKNVLMPAGVPGAPSLPGTSGVGIATVPTFSTRR